MNRSSRSVTLHVSLAILFIALGGCTDDVETGDPAAITQEPVESTAAATSPEIPRYSIEQFMDTERIGGASFSPDGQRILFSSNRSGVFNAYAQPVDSDDAQRLTESDSNAIFSIAYFPNDERILYSSDIGGNELSHIYLREADGNVRDLTPGDDLLSAFHGFSADGRSLWISTNERDPGFFDVYEYDVETLDRTMIFQNDGAGFIGPISPDGRYIAIARIQLTNDSDILLFDRESDETQELLSHPDQVVANTPAEFSADSRALYYTTDLDHEFSYLVRRDLTDNTDSEILKLDWDVMGASRSRGDSYLVVASNEDARTKVRLLNAEDHGEVELPPLPPGNLSGIAFSADDSRVALYVNDSRIPSDLFIADMRGTAPRPLTRALNPEIDPAHLVDGEVVRFRSYDGTEIPGILYKPHGASSENKVPMLVQVHGGPGGQARIGYRAQVQYLVNSGYAIFDINNRGSSGYGKSFFAADDRCHGECDLGDVVAAKDFLVGHDWVDGERVGIIGGSYGGYMVAAALAFEPDVFDVGVNIFGVTNWIRTLESIPPWWEAQRDALYAEMGDPAVDGDRLRRISPLFHAQQIESPLIVLQGANDPRVLQVESDELVAAVSANDVPVEYVVFPDEGHGFVKRENEIEGYRAIRDFLDRYL